MICELQLLSKITLEVIRSCLEKNALSSNITSANGVSVSVRTYQKQYPMKCNMGFNLYDAIDKKKNVKRNMSIDVSLQ